MLPPAFSIAARADAETVMSLKENFLVRVPPTILTGRCERAPIMPRSTSVFGDTSTPDSKSASTRVSESATASGRVELTVRPRFLPSPRRLGSFLMMSRHSGRFLRPERAFWPFVPRPEVLPRLPPRPTRVFARAVIRFKVLSPVIQLFGNALQCLDSGARVVYWVVAARKYLCGDVGHAGELERGAHRRTGDQSASWRGAYLDARCAEFRFDVVADGAGLGEIEGYHGTLRVARRLFDSECGVGRFAKPDHHATLFVAQDESGAEVEAATAGHNTRYAANADEFLREFTAALVASAAAAAAVPPAPAVSAALSARRAAVGRFVGSRDYGRCFSDHFGRGYYHFLLCCVFCCHTIIKILIPLRAPHRQTP